MSEKQAHLNGAFYGPSIPHNPPKKVSYLSPGRGRGSCCGVCCLLTVLLEIIITVAVAIGIAAFIFWLIYRPNLLKFHVTDAELTTFNLTTTNTLNYDLKFNLTLRNPNKKIGVYYDRIEARAYLEDQRFGAQTFTPFYQGHKNTTVLSAVFQGQKMVLLDSDHLSDFNEDKAAGVYSIDMKLYLRVRFKIGSLKTFRFKPKIKCDLNLPLSTAGGFQTTKCDFDW